MDETIEEIRQTAETIDKEKEYFYVSVSEFFTSIKKIKFDKIKPKFYGAPRLQFDILNGFDLNDDKVSLYTYEIQNKLYNDLEVAIKELRTQLETILCFDKKNTTTRVIIENEVNKRFGEALNQYFLSINQKKGHLI
jgi:hypothetical protein